MGHYMRLTTELPVVSCLTTEENSTAGNSNNPANDTRSPSTTTRLTTHKEMWSPRGCTEHWSLPSLPCVRGYPLRWPNMLQSCQVIMNQAVHTSTGQQPFFIFFGCHPSRLVGTQLPSTEKGGGHVNSAHPLIKETHQKMARGYRDVANRRRKTQSVEVGVASAFRKETTVPSTWKTKFQVGWPLSCGGETYRGQCVCGG